MFIKPNLIFKGKIKKLDIFIDTILHWYTIDGKDIQKFSKVSYSYLDLNDKVDKNIDDIQMFNWINSNKNILKIENLQICFLKFNKISLKENDLYVPLFRNSDSDDWFLYGIYLMDIDTNLLSFIVRFLMFLKETDDTNLYDLWMWDDINYVYDKDVPYKYHEYYLKNFLEIIAIGGLSNVNKTSI